MREESNITMEIISAINFNEPDIDFMISGMYEGMSSGALIKHEITRDLIIGKIHGAHTNSGDGFINIINFYLVAYYNNVRAGFVEITCYPSRGDFEIHYIYVMKDYRRKKLATFLIKNALNEISFISESLKLKNKSVFARILKSNKNIPSENLLKSINFKQSVKNYPNFIMYEINN